MTGIVNAALALVECEAPNIAAVQGPKPATGTAEATEDFKKKLEDCEAAIVPAQTANTNGSAANTDDGIQEKAPKAVNGIAGAGCILEGLEMPKDPSGIAQAIAQMQAPPETAAIISSAAQGAGNATGQPEGTTQNIAGTQNTTAGEIPVKTQDDILKAVGAYLDADADTESISGQAQPAQGNTPPMQVQTQTAEKAGQAPAGEQQPQQSDPNASSQTESIPVNGTAEGATRTAADTAQPEGYAQEPKDAAKAAPAKQEAVTEASVPDDAGKTQAQGIQMQAREATPPANGVSQDMPEAKAADHSRFAKENVLRIVDRVSTKAADGRYDFDVELKPGFLGKVSIKLTMEDGSIRMQIKTDDISVKGMLTDQTSSLQNALKDKGIALTSVDVTYESQASFGGEQQSFEQSRGWRQGSAYYAQTETGGFEQAEPYSYYIGTSSVEFLA